MTKHKVITPSHLFRFSKNPLWIWHDLFGDQTKKEPLSEFSLKIIEDGNLHEQEYISKIQVTEVQEKDPARGVEETLRLMRIGTPLIYQGWLEQRMDDVIYRGRPDLLERRPGSSNFGDWVYVPIDVKSSSEVKTSHREQLAFYSMVLSSIQGYFPQLTSIINGNFENLEVFINKKILQRTQKAIEEILAIFRGKKPSVHISSSMKDTPWYKECLREAEERRDISLIYKLRKDAAEALRGQGIDTIDKLATQNLDELPKIPGASIETMNRAKIQAQSLVDRRPIFIGSPEPIPETALKLYFDIEGVKSPEAEYLFGFWIVGDPRRKYAKIGHVVETSENEDKYFLYFIAEAPELESVMWNDFLEWLRHLPADYKVYHYADYEVKALNRLAKKYKSSDELCRFKDQLIDLENSVHKTVILPLYFYSLKDIAKSSFVNFKWRHAKASGGQSVFWYEQWLETKDQGILQDIIDYNEDDVRATEHVHIWMNAASK
jgi:predicted RecB family nuclease